jgi:hypothetical protein
MKTVYYDNRGPKNQRGFRGGGSAWWVRRESDRPWDEHFAEFDISEDLYWALFHLGLMDDFYGLPHDGLLGAYEEGVLRAEGLGKAAEVLLDKAQNLSSGTYEWICSEQVRPDRIEYRILVNAAALRRELIALAEFLDGAPSKGYDVQLWL